MKKLGFSWAVAGLLSLPAFGQVTAPNPAQRLPANSGNSQETMPVFRVTVVGRTTQAINYRHRGGATKIDFKGTPLLPRAHGEAKVESKQGYIEIEVEFRELEPATKYGPEYLTYVMWAITPEGRATNLGEVLLNGRNSKLNVTTELQSFGLIITAEPYFAVSQPSDVVIMENAVRPDTLGKIELVDAKYELLKRGSYAMNLAPGAMQTSLDPKVPLELYEARNAVAMARAAGADRYAAETFTKASASLQQAEDYQNRKAGRKPVSMTAREAAQAAEDSRLIAFQRIEQERQERERQAGLDREAASRAAAEKSERDRAAEERARRDADQARLAADQARASSEQARMAAEQAKRQAEMEAQQAQQLSAKARADEQAAKLAAETARLEAERIRAASEQERLAAQAEADRARREAEEANRGKAAAEREKAELRTRLQQQLNVILETRDSARGLIVNMSDVLFDTGQYTLRAGAREKLAKVSGIVLAHPGLKLEVEGHTDSVGGDSYNQTLSEQRAEAVRKYLVQQGIGDTWITARGFGKTMPVVSNDSAAGRQRNRRVELVVSGEPIGVSTKMESPTGR